MKKFWRSRLLKYECMLVVLLIALSRSQHNMTPQTAFFMVPVHGVVPTPAEKLP